MNSQKEFATVFDTATRLWHFTADMRPQGCSIATACGHFVSFPSEGYLPFYTWAFTELEMLSSSALCLQCRVLGRHAFIQLRDDV